MFAAIEASIVLKLDAQIRQPTVGLTTTTRRPDFSLADLRAAEQRLWRALRTGREIGRMGRPAKGEQRHEPFRDLKYCGFVEWTTGKGTRAGGHRRPHIHHLVKGIPADHPLLEQFQKLDDDGNPMFHRGGKLDGKPVMTTKLEQRVSALWEAITGDAYVVECRPLRTPAGAIAYLTLHHHKKEQAPPPGIRVRRLRPSSGYYEEPIALLRTLAQQLAAHQRVQRAVKDAIAQELWQDESIEVEVDDTLTEALVHGLRSLVTNPSEQQLDFDMEYVLDDEKELVARTVRECERIRSTRRPELVRVRERLEFASLDGVKLPVWRATQVMGPA